MNDSHAVPREWSVEAELATGVRATVVIRDGLIHEVIPCPARSPRLRAHGATVMPGLWDHHRHLRARAARRHSVDVTAATERSDVARLLAEASLPTPGPDAGPSAASTTPGWLRVVGYDHERCGLLDSRGLDAAFPTERPIRVQHRSGHQWVLNGAALRELRAAGAEDVPDDGILWDRDDLLRTLPTLALGQADVQREVEDLVRSGCVGFTDLTATSSPDDLDELAERVRHRLDFAAFGAAPGATPDPGRGPQGNRSWGVKLVLQEHDLPDPEELARRINAARPAPVAIHTVTAESLVLAMVALEIAGGTGDRLEHAFVTPASVPLQLARSLARRGGVLPQVCVNPGFIRTHADRHLAHGSAADVADYQRLRSWSRTGFRLLGGTDAPFGPDDPWLAMAAAVDRRSRGGQTVGPDEALTPEEAFTLFTRHGLQRLGVSVDELVPQVGEPADLCILDRPWSKARSQLDATRVLATVRSGQLMWSDSHPSLEVTPS